jgi:HNH endonuclease
MKYSKRGSIDKWIEQHVNFDGKDCLIWPFARHKDGRAKMRRGKMPAQIMCLKAKGPAPSKEHEVAHSCGNGSGGCVHPKHLRWATRKDNHADKKLHGTFLIGERVHNAKLNPTKVLKIRSLFSSKKLSLSQIARKMSVSDGCIKGVIYGQNWGHVQ